MNNYVKNEIKNHGYKYELVKKLKNMEVPVIKDFEDVEITCAGKYFIVDKKEPPKPKVKVEEKKIPTITIRTPGQRGRPAIVDQREDKENTEVNNSAVDVKPALVETTPVAVTPPKKEGKHERIMRVAGEITASWEKMRELMDMFKDTDLVIEQATYISVDTLFMLKHFAAKLDRAVVDRVLGEDLDFCMTRVRKQVKECRIREIVFNYSLEEGGLKVKQYHCCYCSSSTFDTLDGLMAHIEVEHQSKVMKCVICENVFMNFGSYLSHICLGPPGAAPVKAKFNCRVCLKLDISNFYELQAHMRKVHNICEICMKVSLSKHLFRMIMLWIFILPEKPT